MSDKESAEYYANPENRRIVGPPRRREAGTQLSNHIPIRFAASTIGWVRMLAARDSVTVSSWLRAVVEREVERRLPFARTGVTTYELHRSLQDSTSTNMATVNQTGDTTSTLELVAS